MGRKMDVWTGRLAGGDPAVQCPQMTMALSGQMNFSKWSKYHPLKVEVDN